MEKLLELLKEKEDLKYRDFTASANPTYNKKDIIGVRIPDIRNIAKEVKGSKDAYNFLSNLPHKYLEENLLHMALLEYESDYNNLIKYLNDILPHLKSWSETDTFNNKVIKKNLDNYIEVIKYWINNDNIYTKRFAICQLMKFYLGNNFKREYLELVGNIPSLNEYYLQMMIAWFFATAFAKHYEETLDVFINSNLDTFTFNKTISKCSDSFRITLKQKDYLKSLRKK